MTFLLLYNFCDHFIVNFLPTTLCFFQHLTLYSSGFPVTSPCNVFSYRVVKKHIPICDVLKVIFFFLKLSFLWRFLTDNFLWCIPLISFLWQISSSSFLSFCVMLFWDYSLCFFFSVYSVFSDNFFLYYFCCPWIFHLWWVFCGCPTLLDRSY